MPDDAPPPVPPSNARRPPPNPAQPAPDEFYRLMVMSIRDYAVFALDPLGRVMTWNPGAERLKGYRAEEIIGRHFSTFYPDLDVARGKPAHELRIAAEYGRFEDEGWRLRQDGSRFWANVVITAIRRRGSSELIGFSKVTRDLTDRRQDEEALRLSEERFRLLVEGVTDYAIILLDPDGHVQSWNAGAQRLKGYRPGEIMGEHFSRFYAPEDRQTGKHERELETAIRDGRYEEEGWRVRKDGSRFWANVVLTSLHDPTSGRLLGFSKVTRDLTERRRNEERLRNSYRDMESFSYTVSHDLRAPLRAMLTIGDYIQRDHAKALPESVREDLDRILHSAQQAANLVEDLLRFARAGAADLKHEVVDLTQLAKELAIEHRARSGRVVEVDVEPNLRATGDAGLIRIVLDNLLSNAWKFTKARKDPRVEVRREGQEAGYVTFLVRDNGVGFDPKMAGELFQAFRRLHGDAEYDGTGIGLATVRRIVERHGGRAWATSGPGPGATFFFQLPEAPDEGDGPILG